jgi:putative protease
VHAAQEDASGDALPLVNPAADGAERHEGTAQVWLLEESTRPGALMPIEEDEHGTYILNSRDLRAIEHVERLVAIGVDSLKIEGRTKSPYYAARTCQSYRAAIDDACAGRALNPQLLGELEGLANRGYTDGFYQRHPSAERQNYLRGHSESGRSLLVGEVIGYDANRRMLEVEVKNAFGRGDRVEFIQPGGNRSHLIASMHGADGEPLQRIPGSGKRVWVALPDDVDPTQSCYIARYL